MESEILRDDELEEVTGEKARVWQKRLLLIATGTSLRAVAAGRS